MSIVAIIGDAHFSVKNGNKQMLLHQLDFFYEQLIPFCKANQIDTLYFTGDIFDVRKVTDNYVLEHVKQLFNEFNLEGFSVLGLVGNHDAVLRNSNMINTPTMHLDGDIICAVDQIFSHDDIDLIPWITEENNSTIYREVQASDSKYCIGHFEFSGFNMSKGVVAKDGLDSSIFSEKYTRVISGHYHTKSSKGNVDYVGTPYELTWADYDDPKGFHVFDTDLNMLTFIENPTKIFVKLTYDDSIDGGIPDIDSDTIFSKWVRVTVKKRKNQEEWLKFEKLINSLKPAELIVIEDLVEHNEKYRVENVDITNTYDIMSSYVENTEFSGSIDKKILLERLQGIYREALLQ